MYVLVILLYKFQLNLFLCCFRTVILYAEFFPSYQNVLYVELVVLESLQAISLW